MTKTCNACAHDRRSELDAALSRGEPYSELAREFGVSQGQLRRHRKAHLTHDGAGGGTAPAQEPDTIIVHGDFAPFDRGTWGDL